MTKAQAIALFGSVGKLARAIGVRSQAVSQWPEGEIYEPRNSQVILVALERGLIPWRMHMIKKITERKRKSL